MSPIHQKTHKKNRQSPPGEWQFPCRVLQHLFNNVKMFLLYLGTLDADHIMGQTGNMLSEVTF